MSELAICPEGLQVAEAYLRNKSSISATAEYLGLSVLDVEEHLCKKEVQRYLDRLYLEAGFRNRDLMGALVDEVIKQKIEEMRDTGLGSNKDIMDILKIAHDMKIKEIEAQAKLQSSNVPTVQVNTQNNYGGENYNRLLERLTQ